MTKRFVVYAQGGKKICGPQALQIFFPP